MVTNKAALWMELTFGGCTFKILSDISFPLTEPGLPLLQCRCRFTPPHTVLASSLHSNPPPAVCPPLFTAPPACILMYICKARGPAPLIRSSAQLKGIHREGWCYLLLSSCPPCPPTVLVINDVGHFEGGGLSDSESPTKQSRGWKLAV